MSKPVKIMVVGAGGFVGTPLVAALLADGHFVLAYDAFLYSKPQHHPHLFNVKADVRDLDSFKSCLTDVKAVIHLACISNDPSAELDPELTKEINYDSFQSIVEACIAAGVERFIYASSSSVYGVSTESNVYETHPFNPLTDYSKWKVECEKVLYNWWGETTMVTEANKHFHFAIVRPGTICGPSRTMRFDTSVNGFTNEAICTGGITVKGGGQMRANLNIKDMIEAYRLLLRAPTDSIAGQAYNVSGENYTTLEMAERVKRRVEQIFPEKSPIKINVVPTDDNRSYHINSSKFKKLVEPVVSMGIFPKCTLEQAVVDTCIGFQNDWFPNSMKDDKYYRVRHLRKLTEGLKAWRPTVVM